MRERVENINIENAKLMFKNFSGKNDRFNPGRRNFSVIIEDEETALALKDEGWNIKTYQHDPEEPVIYRLEVRIKWKPFRPTIWMITESGGKTLLNEDTIDTLDDAEIKNVDIVIRPYVWEMGGNSGIAAYVKTMYVTIVEDVFAAKYRDID